MKSIQRSTRRALVATVLTAILAAPAFAQTPSDVEALREQIRLLDQKLRVLERNIELKDEAAAADAKKLPKLTASDGRIEITSADGANSLRLRGLVQADARFYLDDANAAQDGFLLRRARLVFEGKFSNIFTYTVQPEFAGTIQILDANINAAITPAFNIRVGRFKTPIGLEQLQSDPVAFFNERSVVTNLTPNRDVGIQLHGDVLGNRLNYAVGAFNGQLDGGNSPTTNLNAEGDFSVASRVFATPFVNDQDSALKGLGFGVAYGQGNYVVGAPGTAYRTDGQQTFFSYRATTVTNGEASTLSPQAYFYSGPVGILAEYVASSVELANGANKRELTNTGFNVSTAYVLTGEDSSYKGVTPKTSFSPSAGTWGAFEVVARFAQVDIDNNAFVGAGTTSLANRANSATALTTFGLGLNWYLSKTVRVNLDLFKDDFKLAPGTPAPAKGTVLRDDELAFISRVQVSF
jgi:phosphate-selective porin OprO and OprP